MNMKIFIKNLIKISNFKIVYGKFISIDWKFMSKTASK